MQHCPVRERNVLALLQPPQGGHRRARALERREVLRGVHLTRDGQLVDNIAHAGDGVQDRRGGHADEHVFEDRVPYPSRGLRDVKPWPLEGVGRERGMVAGGRVGWEAELVHDIRRA